MLRTRPFGPVVLAGVLGLTVVAPPALARPKVVVWPADRGASTVELEAAVRGTGRDVAPYAAVARRMDAGRAQAIEAETKVLQKVEQTLQQSQVAYTEFRFADMVAELAQLETDALAVLARPPHCPTLWEVEFRHGLGLGPTDATLAGDRFELAVAIDAERRPVKALYGPDVSAAFLRAVDVASGKAGRRVRLELEPADARVVVDCARVGDPNALNLRPGLHVIHVSAPGYDTRAQIIDTSQSGEHRIVLRAHPADDPAVALGASVLTTRLDLRGRSTARAVWAASAGLGTDAVVLVDASGDTAWAQVLVGTRRGKRIEKPDAVSAVKGALAYLTEDGRVLTALAVPRPTPPPRDDPKRRCDRKRVVCKWWFWTLVGAGVVGTGLGLGLGLGLPDPGPDRVEISVQ